MSSKHSSPLSLFLLTLALSSVGGVACTCAGQKTAVSLKKVGEACQRDDQCETSLCNGTPKADPVCRRQCGDGCDFAEICTAVGSPDGGSRFACVPDEGGLCTPCLGVGECPYWADQCVMVDGKTVCGRDCSFDSKCPAGFVCSDPTDSSGKTAARQCVPKTGTCDCTPAHQGETRACTNANALGSCAGLVHCDADAGWIGCTAKVPEQEACNGLDDNCNGKIDERSDEVANPAAGIAPITCGKGLCFVSVPGCFDGGVPACTPKAPQSEACNALDDDCDGTVDNGFPNLNQACVAGLGVCQNSGTFVCRGDGTGTTCSAQAGAATAETCNGLDDDCNGQVDDRGTQSCGLGLCRVTVNVCSSGGDNVCTPDTSKQTTEVCNSLDDNCDGVVDDGFNLQTDVNHCGNCGTACAVAHGSPGCDGGACRVGSCTAPYADCNGAYSDGCEIKTDTDVNNCQTCNHACGFAHAAVSCVSSACVMGACNTGYWDLNGVASDGCEVACATNPATTADVPDDAVADTNCDGIDGNEARAIFVDPSGSDTNSGLIRTLPVKTLTKALTLATAGSRDQILVAVGTYFEAITLKAGVGLYSGYATGTWQRTITSRATIAAASPGVVTVKATGVSIATAFDCFTVTSANATVPSGASIAMVLDNSSGVAVANCQIFSGNGASGSNGAAGSPGTAGSIGGAGVAGTSASSAGGTPGAGGASACEVGGSGGTGGFDSGNGTAGSPATSGACGGAAGAFAVCGTSNSSCGTMPHTAPTFGVVGCPGAAVAGAGTAGVGGSGIGAVTGGAWIPSSGGAGGAGSRGKAGGGGGGGGGGSQVDYSTSFCWSGNFCNADRGGGGGGGGGAGCGGLGGAGGSGGGASIAMLLIDSSPGIRNTTLTSANGGNGGNGGAGGPGGAGATGGPGGSGQDDSGQGAAGGKGSDGAAGGGGGGGPGGPSIALFRSGACLPSTTNLTMAKGNGGNGGAGSGAAGTGAAGLSQTLY